MADNQTALNPLLAGETQNELVELGKKVYQDTFRLCLRNAYQSGFLPGETPPQNKEQEYMNLVMQYERNKQVALDETALAGDRIRAQEEIKRMIELEQEMFRA